MHSLDEELILDVAEALGIDEPSLVEKDYHVTQILRALANFQSDEYTLIFAGGTCLSKTINTLGRMSEDIDLKLVPTEIGLTLKNNPQRNCLSLIKRQISALLEEAGYSSTVIDAKNNNKHIEWEVEYTNLLDPSSALRPNIQVETTVCEPFSHYYEDSLISMIAEVAGNEAEVTSILCVDRSYTAAEKLVSLLRRTAGISRGLNWDDDRLIRHVYDIHILYVHGHIDFNSIVAILETIITWDAERFERQNPDFKANPLAECATALDLLAEDPTHAENYNNFLNPLVYKPDAEQDFYQALASVTALYEHFLENQSRF